MTPRPPRPTHSSSRNVRSYVKAELRARKLKARLEAAEARLDPLRARALRAQIEARAKRGKLTGGQLAAAERLLATPPATLALLTAPCTVAPPPAAPSASYAQYGDGAR